MSVLTLASAPEDATALEGAEAHHARLAGELAGRVRMLLTAVDRDPSSAEKIHAGLVAFCDRSLLPHAAAEEAALYPAVHGMPEARLLIESLIGMTELAEAVDEVLLGLGHSVTRVQRKQYAAYQRLRNFACVIPPEQAKVLVYLKADPKGVDLVPGFTRDVKGLGHHGTGDLEVDAVQSGVLLERTGLTVGDAFSELGDLLLGGLSSG